jgi:bifunctional UDP-N-acetylglucosamine pyrophosphorylase / glucosamine-1-phosphate N-acetyltransferase
LADQNLEVVILAAGQGTRMKSSTIKVLHRAAGRSLIDRVIDLAALVSDSQPIIVVGHQREAVEEQCAGRARFAVQSEQLGTGHALLQTAALLENEQLSGKRVLVLSGDVPLTRPDSIRSLLDVHDREGNGATILSMRLPDPGSYGRIVRDREGRFVRIVEMKDATEEQRDIDEVNTGIYLFEGDSLFVNLRALSSDNAQGEYYLPDVIAELVSQGRSVGAEVLDDPIEALGVNSRAELAAVEMELIRRQVAALMAGGVTFRNPAAVHIDTTVTIGPDTIVYPFVTIEGGTTVGRDCIIEPGVHLQNVRVGDGVHLKSGTVAADSEIGDGAAVGPYAHLRPETTLGARAKIGNFVETKKASFGPGAKASHLSYIGDAEVGADVNIGAGTITCNYDGFRKHKTILEDGVFIGSDSQLVAPVRVGRGSYVGAGSTITKDVPPDSLALSRAPQKTIAGWAAERRQKKD